MCNSLAARTSDPSKHLQFSWFNQICKFFTLQNVLHSNWTILIFNEISKFDLQQLQIERNYKLLDHEIDPLEWMNYCEKRGLVRTKWLWWHSSWQCVSEILLSPTGRHSPHVGGFAEQGRWTVAAQHGEKAEVLHWLVLGRDGERSVGFREKGGWSTVVKVISSREWRGVGSRRKDLNPVYSTRFILTVNCCCIL